MLVLLIIIGILVYLAIGLFGTAALLAILDLDYDPAITIGLGALFWPLLYIWWFVAWILLSTLDFHDWVKRTFTKGHE
jgi:hypothetical protein